MVESLKELNKKCQKPHYKEVGNWMVRKILRPAALPITWLLLHTSITANQVTLLSIGVGLLGIFLCAFSSSTSFLLGMILLQVWYLLDHVDGQIARYRGTSSLSGRFFDFLMHHLLHGTFFFALGAYLFFQTGAFLCLFWGFIVSSCMTAFNLLQDIKYKTFFEKLSASAELKINASAESASVSTASQAKRVFSWIHKSIEMHVVMNLFTLGALFQVFLFPHFDTRSLLFFYYSLAIPTAFIAKSYYWIHYNKIDQEFQETFGER